jgi:anti-sigma factor RsiW
VVWNFGERNLELKEGVMSCGKMESKILGYMDGRLKAGEAREVETHLEACATCRLRVNEFRAVSGLLDELPLIEPSPAFDARVRARVAAEPVKRSWWAWLAPSPRVAFAAAMLVLTMVWIGTRPRQQPALDATNTVAAPEAIANDMPVLENYDVLANFEALTDLPDPIQNDDDSQQDTNQQM